MNHKAQKLRSFRQLLYYVVFLYEFAIMTVSAPNAQTCEHSRKLRRRRDFSKFYKLSRESAPGAYCRLSRCAPVIEEEKRVVA